MNLTIKNIPDQVYIILKRAAAQHGRSLNAEAIRALAEAAEEAERWQRMKDSRPALERAVAKLPSMTSSVPLIRADRRSR